MPEAPTSPPRPEPPPGAITLRLLGGFDVLVGGQRLRLGRKGQALLACLAISGRGGETRGRLAGLLWSESDDAHARAALRQALSEVKSALQSAGYGLLSAERDAIALPDASTDLRAVQDMLAFQQLHPLLRETPRLAASLLPGMEDVDPAFRVWLLGLRRALERQWSRALEAMMAQEAGDDAARTAIAAVLLRLDPTHEAACRCLMRAAHAAGDTASALRAYETLWDALAAEHDMEPSAQTQALVSAIKGGAADAAGWRAGVAQPVPAPPLAATQQPVRMVLLVPHFATSGVAEGHAHLVPGFRHELIACLARFREWVVMDAASPPPLTGLADSPGSRLALEATAMERAGRIGLTLALRDEASRLLLWSECVELSLEGWFDARRHVVSRIAVSLLGSISAARLAETAATPDVSLAAHDKWLRARAMINLFQPGNWQRAQTLYLEAAAEAPGFSPAHSALVEMDNASHIAFPGQRRARATELRAIARAEHAVALDGMDSRAQLALGWALAMAKRYERAASHMQQALRLNRHDPWTLISAALFHAFMGQHAAAGAMAGEALALCPAPPPAHWVYRSAIAFLGGDDAAAAEAAGRSAGVALPSRAWHAAALQHLGRGREAAAAAQGFLAAARAAWAAEEAPTDEAIGHWFMHLFPIAREADWTRLRDGVAGAGIPVAASRHHGW